MPPADDARDDRLNPARRCFYLDSPSNARASGMSVKSTSHEAEINERCVCVASLQPEYVGSNQRGSQTRSFAELRSKIESNGGRVVDLSEPKLTHVVLDKRDLSRRIDLMRRTSK